MSSANQLISSSFMVLVTRVVQQSIGLISTLTLARLLLPQDFGIVAFMSTTVYLFHILSENGLYEYIISTKDLNNSKLNTAWTLNFLLRFSSWMLLVFTHGLISEFFSMGAYKTPLLILSFTIVIRAAKNPGFDLYQKQLNYKRFALLEVASKASSFCSVVSIAFIYRTFWAMIIGELVYSVVFVSGSYILHPHRPKFSFNNFREQFNFSQWMLLRGILIYLKTNLDNLFIKKLGTLTNLGGYFVVKEVALLPLNHVVIPVLEPLLAFFSKDTEGLSHKISTSVLLLNIIAAPVAVYTYFFSDILIGALLGEKWLSYSRFLSLFSFYFYFSCYFPLLSKVLLAFKKVKFLFFNDMVIVLLIIGSLIFAKGRIEYIIKLFALIQLVLTVMLTLYIKFNLAINFTRGFVLSLPPIFLALSSYLVIRFFYGASAPLPGVIQLLGTGIPFVFMYILLIGLFIFGFKDKSHIINQVFVFSKAYIFKK